AHLSEAADPDHHDRRTRMEPVARALDRVIRRECRVREWRRLRRVEIANQHEEARTRNEHVFGHAAVETEATSHRAELVRALALIPAPEPTRPTSAASPRPVDENGVSLAKSGDAGAELHDAPGVLVSERERQLPGHLPFGPLHHVQIRVTRT